MFTELFERKLFAYITKNVMNRLQYKLKSQLFIEHFSMKNVFKELFSYFIYYLFSVHILALAIYLYGKHNTELFSSKQSIYMKHNSYCDIHV